MKYLHRQAMKRNGTGVRPSSVPMRPIALILLMIMGCSDPPAEELMQAEVAIRTAQAAGAEDYAPADFKGAAEALADARSKVESKDYTGARAAALLAKKKAERARANVDAGKQKMKVETEASLTALQQAWSALAKGMRERRMTDREQGDMDELRKTVTKRIAEVRSRMEAGDYAGAAEVIAGTKKRVDEATARGRDGTDPGSLRRQ